VEGEHLRNAKGEGGNWTSHAASSVHVLFHEKSEAGEQLKMDNCYTVLHKKISLSNGKNNATFCSRSRTFSLICMGKLCFIHVILPSEFFPLHNCNINQGVPVFISKTHHH
jgi:hypothetical protein